jgi:hypothetical protein
MRLDRRKASPRGERRLVSSFFDDRVVNILGLNRHVGSDPYPTPGHLNEALPDRDKVILPTLASAKAMDRMDWTKTAVDAVGLRPPASGAFMPVKPTPIAGP